VHPTHIPLEIESEAIIFHRPAYSRPGGRFLGDGQDIRVAVMNSGVELTDEVNRFQIFPTAMSIWDPLAGFS
jgi:hypothetical protein